MSFSSDSVSGVRDRWNGAADYDERRFRYMRNAYYTESPLYRAGQDLEVCSALMYLRILFESGLSPEEIVRQPGWADAREVIAETCSGNRALMALQENARLRARIRYLTAALRGALTDGQVEAAGELGLADLSSYLEGTVDLDEILYPDGVLAVSAHLGGDIFRLDWALPPWQTGAEARAALDRLLARVRSTGTETPIGARLGSGQDCLMTTAEPYTLEVGISGSSRTHAGDVNEFVHFAVPAEAMMLQSWRRKYGARGLAILIAFEWSGSEDGEVLLVPVPSAFSFGRDRLLIRANCGGLMELSRQGVTGDRAAVDAWFVVLGWSGQWN